MDKKTSAAYNPKETEPKIYRQWEKSGFFSPASAKASAGRPDKKKKTYVIALPPPNITGSLHMGHALNATIQDILIRWKRLQGYKTLWLPGTDHAGIATQNVVEKELKKQGLTRHDLGREKFLRKVWQWKEEYGNRILDQLKQIGCSCDWSRTAFTMDKDYQKAVEEVFLHYYKKKWIYQGKRVVNWCPRCQTSLSDLELEYKEEKTHLWFIKYPLADKSKKHLTVATTRPETMLGDTAVAVNPSDKRYKTLVGKKVALPLTNREIPIVADKAIEMEFGTGAVKVTPAHSMTDAEIAQRHNLPSIQVISDKGRMTKRASSDFASLTVSDARYKVIEELKKRNLIEKIEDYVHQVPVCYRCGNKIEQLISQQWFLKMDQLAKMAIQAVETNQVKFHPLKWEKVYLDWLSNIKDWCIPGQIWWGHKIPIDGVDDVLDTWFSSALWPLTILGWPKKTKDLKEFYPTDTLSTARDIINLWVARMVFSGLEFMKKAPFENVFIHPTVVNKEGKRMSKSLGTGVDPLKLIDQYGADATRFGLAYQVLDNQDIKFSEDSILAGKKFTNKIWNASRFVLQQIEGKKINLSTPSQIKSAKFQKNLTGADKKILKQLADTAKKINADLEKFRFGHAAHILYDFFWRDFCDKYIEAVKKQDTKETKQVLVYVLTQSLILLHPFIPFVTESIYQKLPFKREKFLMIEKWPI